MARHWRAAWGQDNVALRIPRPEQDRMLPGVAQVSEVRRSLKESAAPDEWTRYGEDTDQEGERPFLFDYCLLGRLAR
jgi:hypothetical protein